MSVKPILEATAKQLLHKHLKSESFHQPLFVSITQETTSAQIEDLPIQNPWLLQRALVVKPDQLIKRRGKLGLIKVNVNWEQVKQWLNEYRGKTIKVGNTEGVLKTFIVEPFLPHAQNTEFYLSLFSASSSTNTILFSTAGGVDVDLNIDATASRLEYNVSSPPPTEKEVLASTLLSTVPTESTKASLAQFIASLLQVYTSNHFAYLEINPLVVVHSEATENAGTGLSPVSISILDVAAKIDQTAEFECRNLWKGILHSGSFPPPFGRDLLPEEAYIQELDSKTGSSLKLTILNPEGRIWTMVAGGGASVIYADTICDLGYSEELANYGEYSGAPTETQTYEYSKTMLKLMTRHGKRADGKDKILFIGGGIANFTNVASTFKGIEKALREYAPVLKEQNVRVYVRRGGPNYQEGLKTMRSLSADPLEGGVGLNIEVFGPETHMTSVVSIALKNELSRNNKKSEANGDVSSEEEEEETSSYAETRFRATGSNARGLRTAAGVLVRSSSGLPRSPNVLINKDHDDSNNNNNNNNNNTNNVTKPIMTNKTRSLIFGMQPQAVQGMLDFDTACKRTTPSVAGMIYPFSGNHVQKFYWGTKEVMIPVYQKISEAITKHPDVEVIINFASSRSSYDVTNEIITNHAAQIKLIAIIAEGIPENYSRKLVYNAKKANVMIIGPATVGGLKPGCFKIGNTGGSLDNIISPKLYRPGSVAYVSRSGGMSNELNNIISRVSDGVYEGVAIGGDRWIGSNFFDHILRYEKDPEVKMMVLLGEVGGIEELRVAKAIEAGEITKPIVAWCTGTCAGKMKSEVQFGHAGALANGEMETADYKNNELRRVGCKVPDKGRGFDQIGELIHQLYEDLVTKGRINPKPEPETPKVPIDYSWAAELGLIRKPTSFMSSITDERGEELIYAGMPISDVFKEDIGIGGVVSLLWFKRRLPKWATDFIEMCLMISADHGPAVSGAHNTIVTARAGKDLISSLVAGLLTIGDRFGGALDAAAKQFSEAYDQGLTAEAFVTEMRRKNVLLMGIGHKVKSLENPDKRCEILKNFAMENFPSVKYLKFGLEVEKITTSKKANLILNVDGVIGLLFVDLLRDSGAFTREEAAEYINIGTLNGLFVLGRSIGFIGHYLDQKRLKQGLYRHPWSDITYLAPDSTMGGGGDGGD